MSRSTVARHRAARWANHAMHRPGGSRCSPFGRWPRALAVKTFMFMQKSRLCIRNAIRADAPRLWASYDLRPNSLQRALRTGIGWRMVIRPPSTGLFVTDRAWWHLCRRVWLKDCWFWWSGPGCGHCDLCRSDRCQAWCWLRNHASRVGDRAMRARGADPFRGHS